MKIPRSKSSLSNRLVVDQILKLEFPMLSFAQKGSVNSETLSSGFLEIVDRKEKRKEFLEGLGDQELNGILRNIKRGLFFSQNNSGADYNFYAKKDLWTIAEITPLLLGLNPKVYQWQEIKAAKNDSDMDRRYKEIRELIYSSYLAGKFGLVTIGNFEYVSVHPIDALNWAFNKQIEPDSELIECVRQYHEKEEVVNKGELITALEEENKKLKGQLRLMQENPIMDALPEGIHRAIDFFDECWKDLPHDMQYPSKSEQEAYVEEKWKGIDGSEIAAIRNLGKPEGIVNKGKPPLERVKEWKKKNSR